MRAVRPTFQPFVLILLAAPALFASGCARPQRTPEQVAGYTAPYDLQRGPQPPGGQAMAPTAAGAGGSAAGGAQNEVGRVGGIAEQPTVSAPHGDAINVESGNRMSPTTDNAAGSDNSDGSGTGDTGHPIPPSVSLAAPPDRKAKVRLAPASNEPPSLGPAAKPQPRSDFGAANNPVNSLPGQ